VAKRASKSTFFACVYYRNLGDGLYPIFIANGVTGLREMAQRFPTLEVRVVAQTHGFFRDAAVPTPAQEAEHLHQEWAQAFYHIPVGLIVSTTPFTHLPAPDQRWVPRPWNDDPNVAKYTLGGTWSFYEGAAFLVDQQGLIVWASNKNLGTFPDGLTKSVEREVAEAVEVTKERDPHGEDRALCPERK